MEENAGSELMVIVSDSSRLRAVGDKFYRRISISAQDLSGNVNIFLGEMEKVLKETPEKMGKFHLTEISVSAEITADGQIVLCGVGGEIGISGGLQFTFKREVS